VRKIICFLLKLLGFYLLWLLCDNYWDKFVWFKRIWYYPQYGLLKEIIFFSTSILSKGFLLNVQIVDINKFLIEGREIIEIGAPCFGHELMYFFSVFIISYPGQWKRKIYYILFGCFLINYLNILRIVGLSFIFLYFPQYADFNHHFLFTFIIYTVVFSMWLVWIRYFSNEEQTDVKT